MKRFLAKKQNKKLYLHGDYDDDDDDQNRE